MNLRTYLDQERGRAAELARALKMPPVLLSQWSSGARRVPAERCPAIERETGGVVRCEDLRPDVDWAYLRGTNCPADQRDPARDIPHVMPAKRASNGHKEAA